MYRILKEYGLISHIARKIGRTKGHVLRCLKGERTMTPEIETACREAVTRILRGDK